MANDVTSNPLIVDSTGSMIATSYLKIQKIRWAGAVASKTITLKDRTGKVRWKAATGAAFAGEGVDSDFNPPLQMDGLTVEDISTAGTLYIYLTDCTVPVKTT